MLEAWCWIMGVSVEDRTIFVIGGDDDETISLSGQSVGRDCRLTCVARGETFTADATDYFAALGVIRRRFLEPKGLIPFCYGASLKVWPSGMARDMGQGLRAYKIELGQPAGELIGIFDAGADVIPAPVEAQEEFARDWISSLRGQLPAGPPIQTKGSVPWWRRWLVKFR